MNIKFEIINGTLYTMTEQPCPHCSQPEIIATPVAAHSTEWALYQMMQGYIVNNSNGIVPFMLMEDRIVRIDYSLSWDIDHWLRIFDDTTGWQIYEPKPEPAKEPEIVAHKQHANCLVCRKEIEGLLDGHATVSIKRYSISSLYESTYSHYCGKCFLELGFDATERELRNRQQPIAEPKPKVVITKDGYNVDDCYREPETKRCGGCGSILYDGECKSGMCENDKSQTEPCDVCGGIGMISCEACNATGRQLYEPQPPYAVGDWVQCGIMQAEIRELREILNGRQIYHMKEADGTEYDADSSAFVRKISSSEVVVHIGCLSGTVRQCGDKEEEVFALHAKNNAAVIPFAMLDEPTLKLVRDLLEKQKGETR